MRSVFYFVIFLTLISCQSNRNDKVEFSFVEREFHPNGMVSYEWMYNEDSVLNGLSRYFNSEGKLELEMMYKDGEKNGVEKGFYKNGQLKYIGYNSHGKSDSVCIWYYENGSRKALDYWNNGVQFGAQLKFYANGKFKEYFINDIEGHTVYSRKYSIDGSHKDEGNPIYFIYSKGEISRGEKLEVIFFLASPENCEVKFVLSFNENGKGGVVDEQYREKYNNMVKYFYTITPNDTMDINIQAYLVLTDTIAGSESKFKIDSKFIVTND